MKFHIVRINETKKMICDTYNLELDELKECNKHVKNWDKLLPGIKLKIPVISNAIDEEVMDMEPFIEDYYPANHQFTKEDKKEDDVEKVFSIKDNESDVNINEFSDLNLNEPLDLNNKNSFDSREESPNNDIGVYSSDNTIEVNNQFNGIKNDELKTNDIKTLINKKNTKPNNIYLYNVYCYPLGLTYFNPIYPYVTYPYVTYPYVTYPYVTLDYKNKKCSRVINP